MCYQIIILFLLFFLVCLISQTNTRNVFHPINFLLDAYVQFLVNIWFLGKTVFKTMFLRFLRTNIMINFNVLSIKPFFHNSAQRRRTGSVESVECKEDWGDCLSRDSKWWFLEVNPTSDRTWGFRTPKCRNRVELLRSTICILPSWKWRSVAKRLCPSGNKSLI